MAPNLTIRNLSAVPIDLKLLEYFEAPKSAAPQALQTVTSWASNITSTIGITRPGSSSNATVAEGAQGFDHEEVSIRIDPFQSVNTDKAASKRDGNEIMRLVFDAEGQGYKIDVPLALSHSNFLTPLGPSPRYEFLAIFVPGDTFLALYQTSPGQSWMGELRDSIPLSMLSIPGTHNAPTYHPALPSVRCQAVPPHQQLNNGVRFFDIRVQPETPTDASKDGLILVHGVFPVSLTGNKYFRDLVNDVRSFLDANRSETVIISIKREGTGDATDAQLGNILRDHYAGDINQWWTEPRIPRLGEARGKIVLVRRFGLDDRLKQEWDGRGWGINAEGWAYNTASDQRGDVCVQDFCEVLETVNVDHKIQVACDQLQRSGVVTFDVADNVVVPPLYLNFLSASNFWKVGCWPDKIAARLNPAIVNHLCMKHVVESANADWCTGIVICDWVGDGGDWDLIRSIIGMNTKLRLRTR